MKFNHIKSDHFIGYFYRGWFDFYLPLRGFLVEERLHLGAKP